MPRRATPRREEGILYLDASALVKLVRPEHESEALLQAVREWPLRASSQIAAIEVPRAVRRDGGEPELLRQAEAVLDGLALIALDASIARAAAALDPPRLRALDAAHLATALSLGEDLAHFVAYDARLLDAAAAAGLPLLTPGH